MSEITSAPRAPIVTVLGHVDHGKTSLLDALRKSNVAAGEAGGITQSIGVSTVQTAEGKKITFIDTPGHAAFNQMRSRGAQVADIAILVVDATDGVKPQTQEALGHIKTAGIPFIVAATKIDVQSASTDVVYGQLEKEGITFEGRGGDVPLVPVSAKTGKGLGELMETIALVAEVGGIKGSPEATLEAVVIETGKTRGGPVATVIVRSGKISVGDMVYATNTSCKVRGLFDEHGKGIKELLPGFGAQLLGFSELPAIGTMLHSTVLATQNVKLRVRPLKADKSKLGVFLKAENAGSLEALAASMPAEVSVVESSVGDVTESDILMAKSSGSMILAFESHVSTSVMRLAEAEKVIVKRFEIIYELLQDLEKTIKGGQIQVQGKAEILASFPFDNKKVAGCKVTLGKVTKTDSIILTRGDKELGRAQVASLKRGKQELEEAKAGEEFGIILSPQLDFEKGDVLVSVAK